MSLERNYDIINVDGYVFMSSQKKQKNKKKACHLATSLTKKTKGSLFGNRSLTESDD